ncbi:MAG: hypothetical protein C0624_10970 [Desulfuromonas sp.]|nr:MAG: hypothetical protein C0624_10970 [Desulfuromonas sp.]
MSSEKLARAADAHTAVCRQLVETCSDDLERFARQLVETFHGGQRLFIIGSGPLGALASLAANRFIYRLDLDRPALPAMALTSDAVLASALGRDGNSDQVFSRQLGALAAPGDVVLALAGDEQDALLRNGLATAREIGCQTALLTSAHSPLLREQFDMVFVCDADSSARRDEAILFACHLLCELVEAELFGI